MTSLAQSTRRIACIIISAYAMRRVLCAVRARWILLNLSILIVVTGCAQFRPRLTHEELAERLQYGPDKSLEELVNIAIALGYRAVDGAGHSRQVLELSKSESGSIHRQFFEVQPREAGLSDAFFLENAGSVEQTNFSRFPGRIRKDISIFLKEQSESRGGEYKPILVQQQKLSRRMIIYEKSNGGQGIEFTRKVVFLEKSKLYGLYLLPSGPFIFFGEESQGLYRKDFLKADQRYKQLLHEFLMTFQIRQTL